MVRVGIVFRLLRNGSEAGGAEGAEFRVGEKYGERDDSGGMGAVTVGFVAVENSVSAIAFSTTGFAR